MQNQEIGPRSKRYSRSRLLCISAVALAASVQQVSAQSAIVSSFVEHFVQDFLALSPSAATGQGYHEHAGVNLDELLDDYSLAGQNEARRVARRDLVEATSLLHGQVTPEDRADLEVVRLQCESLLLDLDKIQSFRHNPTEYVELLGNALYTPLVLNYAPLDKRLGQITSRLEKTPAFMEVARHNLMDAPPTWNQVAQQENAGTIDLIKSIRSKVPPALLPRFDAASKNAITALQSFDAFLKNDLSKHRSDWRLGKEFYAEKFRLTLATGDTPEQTMADAQAKMDQIREEMRNQALAIYPRLFPGQKPPSDLNTLVSSVLEKIAQRHTTPAHYFDQARADLAEATAFVRDKHLLQLPAGNNLEVIPTPEFMRGVYGVGGFSPAPVLEPKLGAFYWITPFTPDMSAERVESKLREYNTWGLKILTIHEAMPGHYVQAEYASAIQPKWRGALRAIFGNGPYVEGWAVYATRLLIESGYDDSPEMRLTFGKQMLRVVANTILDVKLQTMGMTDQEAMDLMIRDTFQEREEAEKKLQRAKLSSCQLPTYFVGWRAWERLRASVRDQQGQSFSLAGFHEAALREGAVPMPVLRELLLPGTPARTKAN